MFLHSLYYICYSRVVLSLLGLKNFVQTHLCQILTDLVWVVKCYITITKIICIFILNKTEFIFTFFLLFLFLFSFYNWFNWLQICIVGNYVCPYWNYRMWIKLNQWIRHNSWRWLKHRIWIWAHRYDRY